jgi:uncharacterized protein (UPF0210 family)
MNIRSITYFLDPGWPLDRQVLQAAGEFIAAARPALEEAGYPVQTTRLATIPFPQLLHRRPSGQLLALARTLEQAAGDLGFDYLSLGPALPGDLQDYARIPDAIAATENVFFSGWMASNEQGVSLPAVRACAQTIHETAQVEASGFGNLFFAALANVPAGAPFFPAAYHDGGAPLFALATEAADLAVEAVGGAESLQAASQALQESLEMHGRALQVVCKRLGNRFGLPFGGVDFSLAPYPEVARSIGTAMEGLGVPAVGRHGSLAATAFLASALDQADYPRAGFSGVMLPLLEDSILAARAEEGLLSVADLLLYSAVCGTGLDTLPLPGATPPAQLAPVLLDLAALALRLDKPLTARLMPIPGKQAGDPTGFDFAYFANSRVLPLMSEPLAGLFAGSEGFNLAARHLA